MQQSPKKTQGEFQLYEKGGGKFLLAPSTNGPRDGSAPRPCLRNKVLTSAVEPENVFEQQTDRNSEKMGIFSGGEAENVRHVFSTFPRVY